jgi:hypothetical protein
MSEAASREERPASIRIQISIDAVRVFIDRAQLSYSLCIKAFIINKNISFDSGEVWHTVCHQTL